MSSLIGFGDVSQPYKSSKLNLTSKFIQHPSSTSIVDLGGSRYILVDTALTATKDDYVLICIDGITTPCHMSRLYNKQVSTESIQQIGVITCMIQSSVDKVEGTNLDQWLMADINTSWIALNSGNFRHLKHNDILIVHRRKPSCDPLLVICCLDGQFVVAELDNGTLINESKSIHTTLQSENLIEGYVVGSIRRYR